MRLPCSNLRATVTYPLRNVSATLWRAVRAKAKSEGHTVRFVIERLLQSYVADKGVRDANGRKGAGREVDSGAR
jgi:hypothetical protein